MRSENRRYLGLSIGHQVNRCIVPCIDCVCPAYVSRYFFQPHCHVASRTHLLLFTECSVQLCFVQVIFYVGKIIGQANKVREYDLPIFRNLGRRPGGVEVGDACCDVRREFLVAVEIAANRSQFVCRGRRRHEKPRQSPGTGVEHQASYFPDFLHVFPCSRDFVLQQRDACIGGLKASRFCLTQQKNQRRHRHSRCRPSTQRANPFPNAFRRVQIRTDGGGTACDSDADHGHESAKSEAERQQCHLRIVERSLRDRSLHVLSLLKSLEILA